MDWILALPEIQEMVLHHLDAEARREAVLICKDFYRTICHLERNKCLKINKQLIESMVDQKVINSILNSKRRFGEIKINFQRPEEASVTGLIVVLDKFKQHMKKFTVGCLPVNCSAEVLTALLNKATDVEELFLEVSEHETLQNHNYEPDREFSKLKYLFINGVLDIVGILNNIPDNSLERLGVYGLNEEVFQAFLDRQMELKVLYVPHPIFNVDHLALEELNLFYSKDEKELTALLKHQPSLRRLECETIGSAAFNELRKMRYLEVLIANLSNDCTGELTNLKELTLDGYDWPNGVFRRVVLPKLVSFVKLDYSNTGAEEFIALSRSSRNMQHISIQNSDINFLPTIIAQFPKLKMLFVDSRDLAQDDVLNDEGPQVEIPHRDYFVPALSRQNLSLEQIDIKRWPARLPIGFLYDAINACPNLKRIHLDGIICTEQQVLGLIRSHPQLTYFRLNDASRELPLFSRPTGDTDSMHPVLVQIINIFRASADFELLIFGIIANWGNQRVEDLLTDDADRITVYRIEMNGNCFFSLVKKS